MNVNGVAENALTLLILFGLGIMIYSGISGGKIKNSIKQIFKGD